VPGALLAYVPPTWLIWLVGIVLVIFILALSVWAWFTDRKEHASRLITAAVAAFAVLVVQLMIEARAHHDSEQRQAQADRETLILQLGRQKDLSEIDLRYQDLSGFYLGDKKLIGANLDSALLKDAALPNAQLVSANLVRADLRGAQLDGANLRQADLAEADLRGAWLRGAHLEGASLRRGWDGTKKRLVPTDLRGAHLRTAYLQADLRHALLQNARMYGAHLALSNLSDADLSGADLKLADLRGAVLVGAKLRTAKNLDAALDLSHAAYDARTRWPDGFTWPGLYNPCNRPCCRPPAQPCRLGQKDVHDFPPRMRLLRDRLVELTDKKQCPAGWRTDSSVPLELRVVSARGLATFSVAAAQSFGMTVDEWASSFTQNRDVHVIRGVPMGLGYSRAQRYSRETGNTRREEVAVYQIDHGRALRYWGSASPALFPLYERDFAVLFHAVGVTAAGTKKLFPDLRGGIEECA
jgi:uncharacterized protein YjbI with pentapeptide repeats